MAKPTTTNTGTTGALTPYNSTLQITSSSPSTIQNLDIFGDVIASWTGTGVVTLKNCKIRGQDENAVRALVRSSSGFTGTLVLDHCEIVPDYPQEGVNAVQGDNIEVYYSKIHNVVDGIRIRKNTKAKYNILYDFSYFSPCTYQSDNQTHNDAFQLDPGAENWDIQHNTMIGNYGPVGSHPNLSHLASPTPAGETLTDLAAVMFGSGIDGTNTPNGGGGIIANNWIEKFLIPINASGAMNVDIGEIYANKFDGTSVNNGTWTIITDATTVVDTYDFDAERQNKYYDGTPVTVRRNQ